MRIAVINGPNLNLLGVREPSLYGTETLQDVERKLNGVARELGASLEFVQRNGEGELIDAIHKMRGRVDGAVVNAGAYTHSSLALRDALVGVVVVGERFHREGAFRTSWPRGQTATFSRGGWPRGLAPLPMN